MTRSDPLAPPDRPERTPQELLPWLDEQIAGADAKVRCAVSHSGFDYYRGWRDACFNMQNKLREIAVPARAHHQQDEDTTDVMARSGTTEMSDRQPAAVTDGGDQGDCAGTTFDIVVDEVRREAERVAVETGTASVKLQRILHRFGMRLAARLLGEAEGR